MERRVVLDLRRHVSGALQGFIGVLSVPHLPPCCLWDVGSSTSSKDDMSFGY